MFLSPRIPGARRALITVDADARIVDLDDANALLDRDLRPSAVATPDRTTTQTWAERAFLEHEWDGIRWWSVRDARWGVVGLWNVSCVRAREPEPLHKDHPAVIDATAALYKPWLA